MRISADKTLLVPCWGDGRGGQLLTMRLFVVQRQHISITPQQLLRSGLPCVSGQLSKLHAFPTVNLRTLVKGCESKRMKWV